MKTQGGLYANGNSTCTYNGIEIEGKFTIGNETTHTKDLIGLTNGRHNYNILCVDDARKRASEEIIFTIDFSSVPRLTAVYTEGLLLSIEIDGPSECKYSDKNFNYDSEEGRKMVASDNGHKHQASLQKVFYIICENTNNKNRNAQPFIVYT